MSKLFTQLRKGKQPFVGQRRIYNDNSEKYLTIEITLIQSFFVAWLGLRLQETLSDSSAWKIKHYLIILSQISLLTSKPFTSSVPKIYTLLTNSHLFQERSTLKSCCYSIINLVFRYRGSGMFVLKKPSAVCFANVLV